jgi:DNA excision repair protein ERCC-4
MPLSKAGCGNGLSGDPLVLQFTVLIDRQERAGGWRFSGITGDSRDKYRPLVVPTREEHLRTADYTVEGVPIFIERKSVEDFLSTIIHGRERFEREHERMVEIERAGGSCAVVIEGEYDAIMSELESGSSARGIHPSSVEGTIASFERKYGIPWVFAGNRRRAELLAFRMLRQAWAEQQEALKAK